MPVSPARLAAFEILLRVQQQGAFASELLHSERLAPLSTPDRGLCTELVMGSLRWQAALDREIAASSSQKLERLDPEVLVALRLGAYQLRFLGRIPSRAAVNESVELVKHARRRFSAPFVNAVLRKMTTAGAERNPSPPLDSPNEIAEAFAHPPWLVARWSQQYGADAARRICEFDQQQPPVALRFPPGGAVALERELEAEHIELVPGCLLLSSRIVRSGDVTHTQAYESQRLAIQDEGSQLVAALVGQGARILDCCAAPGNKTAYLAERNPGAKILAVELHPHRAELLRRRISRHDVEVITADAATLPREREFDRILADVPCSGTGTLARNPEIKWKLRPEDLTDLQGRQTAILAAALRHLAPGGRLVYSTCSLEPEENESVVEEVLSQTPNTRLLDCRARLRELAAEGELIWPDIESLTSGSYLQTLPGTHLCDGFFAALIAGSRGD